MSIPKISIINSTTTPRNLGGGAAPQSSPFRTILLNTATSGTWCKLKVSKYSTVLTSPNIIDKLLLVGLDFGWVVDYGDKIWLETFFDKNLAPVFSIVRVDKKWRAKTANVENPSELIDVYPNQLEFITKYDIANKLKDLDDVIALVNGMKTKAKEELLYQKNTGAISQEQYTTLDAQANTEYQKIEDLIKSYKKDMNTFFQSAPTALWKKLFRVFTPIAYTTHDVNTALEGLTISPKSSAPQETPSIPQATNEKPYKVVQCLNSDLLIVDYCHQNRYPAKLLIPYMRPVYSFYESGKLEDSKNTE